MSKRVIKLNESQLRQLIDEVAGERNVPPDALHFARQIRNLIMAGDANVRTTNPELTSTPTGDVVKFSVEKTFKSGRGNVNYDVQITDNSYEEVEV